MKSASIAIFFFGVLSCCAQQLDTLYIVAVDDPPQVDGKMTETIWHMLPWIPLHYVWIPYGGELDTASFSGRYKVCWSPSTNRLYFFIDIYDNQFIDGYVFGKEPDIYNYDITEVFIDEDASGGLHVFDGKDDIGKEWGFNAENAFTYHIYAPFPKSGGITREHRVTDLAGTSWDDVQLQDYSSHIPEFALFRDGTRAQWEFSLIVYDSSYNQTSSTNKEVILREGKILGLSVAYCDNDSQDGRRDAMVGSDWEPAPGNLHWMNADYYRKAKLVLKEK